MTDFYDELVADLNAIGVEVEKAKMSRSEAARVAARARWGNKGRAAPKMIEGGWRTAAGIPMSEQKSNARSKAAMQGHQTRRWNKEDAGDKANAGKKSKLKQQQSSTDRRMKTTISDKYANPGPDDSRGVREAAEAAKRRAKKPTKVGTRLPIAEGGSPSINRKRKQINAELDRLTPDQEKTYWNMKDKGHSHQRAMNRLYLEQEYPN